jgi:CheY-like chemotaxis protein
VILVDIDLGGESGFELTERFTQALGRRLPVVLISTYPEQDLAD